MKYLILFVITSVFFISGVIPAYAQYEIDSNKIAMWHNICTAGSGMTCPIRYGSLNALTEPIYKSDIVLVGKIVEAKPILKQNQTEYGIKVDKYIKTSKTFDLITAIGNGIYNEKFIGLNEITYYNLPIFKKDDKVFVYLNYENGTYKISPYSFAISKNIPTGPPPEIMFANSDKLEYRYGDAITISGIIKKAYIFDSSLRNQDSSVYLIARNPDNQVYENKTLDISPDGTFSHSFKIKGKLGIDGQYGYDVRTGGTTWSHVFSYYSGHIKSPLKQFTSGTRIDEIQCKSGFVVVIKASNNNPNCVKPQTLEKLRQRGWAEPLGKIIFQKPSQDTQELAEKSDRIIAGIVTDKETIGNTTQVWIGVYEWLKKSPNYNSIILDIPEGSTESELDFQKGKEMLLFLKDIDLANGHFGIFYLDDKTRPTKYPLSMREDIASFVKPEDKEPYYMYQQNENCESLVLENDSFLYCSYPEEEFRYYIPILKTADRIKQKMLQYVSERYFAEHFDLRRAYDNAVVNGHTVPTGQDFEFNYKLGNQSFLYLVHVFGDDKEAYISYSPPKEIQTLVDENKITELIQSCVGKEAYPIIWDKAMVSRDEKGFTPVITGGTPTIYDRYGNAVLHPTKQQFRVWPETGEVECAKETQDFTSNPILPQKRELLIDSTEFLKIKNRK